MGLNEAYNNYDSNTSAKDLAENPIKFWSYVKSQSVSKVSIQSLVGESGMAIEDNKRKGEVLDVAFKKSFTQENLTDVPPFSRRTYYRMEDVNIGISGVEMQLKELKQINRQVQMESP